MSGIEPPFEDGPSKFDVLFAEALNDLREKGFTPHTIVTPWPTAMQLRAEELAAIHNLKLEVDLDRPVLAGLGIRFEGDAPNVDGGELPIDTEGEEWKQ